MIWTVVKPWPDPEEIWPWVDEDPEEIWPWVDEDPETI